MERRVDEWVQERLRWEDWARLLKHGVAFAETQIRRRRWRGDKAGILPEGQDANGVAAEAITAMMDGRCRLAIGWTWQRLQRELERLVVQEVRRLHSLTEAASMRSEWDVLPPDENEEPRSLFAEMPGVLPDGAAEAMRHEAEEERARIKNEIETALEDDAAAKGVFQCLWDGVVKRQEIATRLGLGVAAVSVVRKRLERRLEAISRSR